MVKKKVFMTKLQENSANSRRMLTSTLTTWTLSKKCVTKQKKKNAETFRLKAEAVKEIFKKDAAVRVKLYFTVIEM